VMAVLTFYYNQFQKLAHRETVGLQNSVVM